MRRSGLIAILVLLSVTAGWSGYNWWNTASSTTSSVSPRPVSEKVLAGNTALRTWQTASFTTKVPNYLRVRSSSENSAGPNYGSYLLTGKEALSSAQIGITVQRSGLYTLAESAGVKFRSNRPDVYTVSQLPYTPPGAMVFSQPDTHETAIFWQRDGQTISVVATGAGETAPYLNDALQIIVGNWQSPGLVGGRLLQ